MHQLSFADQNLIFYLRGGRVATPSDWQLQLQAGDYYFIERPLVRQVNPDTGQAERTEGPSVYGYIITNTPEEGEPPYRPGYFLVRGFSRWAPTGELGTFHISEATRPLTKDQFEAARAAGWPDQLPSPSEGEGQGEGDL